MRDDVDALDGADGVATVSWCAPIMLILGVAIWGDGSDVTETFP